ncbi:MAG: helix-turn-helix domain-containing protein [Polyangiaceae bacterium]|nr:helix-turn-helix domain-containing protein [Polyangiaceae bacterium]
MTVPGRWTGSVYFSDRVFAYVGAVATTGLHAHHATQVAIALDGTMLELGDRTELSVEARGFVVPADAHHAICQPTRALLLYVEPESDLGGALESVVERSGVEAWKAAASTLPALDVGEDIDLRAVVEQLRGYLVSPIGGRDFHPAVQAAIDALPALVEHGEVRVGRIAKQVGLSESRFMHLFREQVGIPLRPYARWLRLRLAANALRRAASLTEAAHAAGFTDSAHFSNVFHETFGLPPSALVKTVTWVE